MLYHLVISRRVHFLLLMAVLVGQMGLGWLGWQLLSTTRQVLAQSNIQTLASMQMQATLVQLQGQLLSLRTQEGKGEPR